jgi:hypothetical protein
MKYVEKIGRGLLNQVPPNMSAEDKKAVDQDCLS